ncbi:carbon-nitrogen hydrolase family protein [Polynucleobacter sp. CS-Odin-A6]|uniref:carbon-nitrogen hydrolase family protein n=1 Tax=Polynucleobacter sp. CS-Odin-A6 TaxID=2689106 RepID=UPI001C0B45D8|nr:carbon-nitrogen hydrolase family protein [Polynucleobacter sp. CS-Odin-A6]MBU3622003.1 carbon-nitrogen hydrolase family protein [Polynucleobacter sp. CS-Odin-A6]
MKKITLVFLLLISFSLGLVHAAEVKVASVSFHSKDQSYNIPKMSEISVIAAKNGAKLVVFPEMASTGFLYSSLNEAKPNLDTFPGKATAAFGKVAQQSNIYIAWGYIELDSATGVAYNSAAIVGPNGFKGNYRKHQLAVGDDNLWRAPGNLGFPVFDTPIGRIALLVCYDDTQLQSLLLPALRNADIIAYPTASLYVPKAEAGGADNHTTIGSMATMPGWIGINVVGADSSGVDVNPMSGTNLIGPAGSAIWDAQGNVLAAASATNFTDPKQPKVIYATINTSKPNPQREFWLKNRRPELYSDYNFYRPSHDGNVNKTSAQISALLVQYEPTTGAVDENSEKIEKLINDKITGQGINLAVLPFNSFIGNVTITKENASNFAEPLNGKSYNIAANLAKKYQVNLLFSMPESTDGKLYETAILFDFKGKQIGLYRKSHLNAVEKTWATAGNELPVFNSPLGRIGILLNDEVRIPEVTDMYMLKRANLLLVPVAYNQKEYGGDVKVPKGLIFEESNKGMFIWFSMAQHSQAHTLVANYVRGAHGDIGQSALYSLVPEEGFYPPSIAPKNKEIAHQVVFATNQNLNLWTNQQQKVVERIWQAALPLTLDKDNACLQEWQKNSTSPLICKGAYQ